MTRKNDKQNAPDLKALMVQNHDMMQPLMQWLLQEVLEQEMTDTLGAAKGERSEGRQGYRSGYYPRRLVTRVGTMELRVPQDRQGHFSTQLFERYQRSEKALVAALVEMYVQGVSTRKIKTITEELCGHEFSASAISELNVKLDGELERFARRALEVEFPYLILDARDEKVREDGVIRSRAVLVAIGIDWEGRRQILAVEIAGRESTTSWRELLLSLKQRGLSGVRLAICQHPPVLPCGQRLRPLAVSLRSAAMITRGSNAPWPKFSPKPPGSAATSTSCAMPSTTSHARPATTA
jgi:transposase-like protein